MECKQPDNYNLTPYYLITSVLPGETCLFGFKDDLAVLGTTTNMSVKTSNLEMDKKTGEKFILINGAKMKVLVRKNLPEDLKKRGLNTISIREIKTMTDKPGKSQDLCNSQSVGECQVNNMNVTTKNQSNKEVQTVTEYRTIACQTDSYTPEPELLSEEFLNSILMMPEQQTSTHRFVPGSAILRDHNDPKIKFFNDIRNALTPDANGNMPIHVAVLCNNLANVKRFSLVLKVLQQSINLENQTGDTPLHLAVINESSCDIIRYLLDSGADLTLTDQEGNTALHLAIVNNLPEILEILCKHASNHKISVDSFNYEGFTPLILCAIEKNLDCAKILLNHAAQPNAQDQKSGRTALFHAAENHHLEMVQLLLLHKADTSIRNFFGTSPHDAMFEMEDIPQDIRSMIWASKKRKNKNDPINVKPKVLKIVKTYQKVK